MAEQHRDKGHFGWSGGEIPKPTGIIKPSWEKTAQEIEEEKRAKLEAEALSFAERKQKLLTKYEQFLEDTTNFDLVNKHPIQWMGMGFIVEIFVADFSDESKLLGLDDVYTKFTPYARVLSASEHNEGPKASIKPGDIVFLGDFIANVRPNKRWEEWAEAGNSNGKLTSEPPIKYIRHVHTWISESKLYFPDKAAYVLSKELTNIDENYLKVFKGPWIFILDPMSIKWPINYNPFE